MAFTIPSSVIIIYSESRGLDMFMSSNFFDENHDASAVQWICRWIMITFLLKMEIMCWISQSPKTYCFLIDSMQHALLLIFFAVKRGYKKK